MARANIEYAVGVRITGTFFVLQIAGRKALEVAAVLGGERRGDRRQVKTDCERYRTLSLRSIAELFVEPEEE